MLKPTSLMKYRPHRWLSAQQQAEQSKHQIGNGPLRLVAEGPASPLCEESEAFAAGRIGLDPLAIVLALELAQHITAQIVCDHTNERARQSVKGNRGVTERGHTAQRQRDGRFGRLALPRPI